MADDPAKRDAAGRFGAGNKANPSGRPRVLVEAIEAFRRPEDLEKLRLRLLEIAKSRDLKAAIAAIREYHDRAFGKPKQVVTGEDGGPVQVDITAIASKIRKLAGDE